MATLNDYKHYMTNISHVTNFDRISRPMQDQNFEDISDKKKANDIDVTLKNTSTHLMRSKAPTLQGRVFGFLFSTYIDMYSTKPKEIDLSDISVEEVDNFYSVSTEYENYSFTNSRTEFEEYYLYPTICRRARDAFNEVVQQSHISFFGERYEF